MISNPKVRKWLYVVGPTVSTVLLMLVTAGVIDEGLSASIANAVSSLIFLATGGVAVSNLSPKSATITADGVAVITDALDAYSARAQPVIGSTEMQVQVPRRVAKEYVDPFIRR
ncbi:hypothetical protein [Prescottella agglutinans]|uniref:Holin n=1 Tax=Prescottella agglutinans TaxID=1644129 RepID=A0ABT6M5J7_9NOCA|nr:hypothetical protein [Prescottella agglutinans]MDH6279550.1 hypothetical protein [Prescottella agglutinans]